MNRPNARLVIAALALLATACGTSTAGSPQPAPSSASTRASSEEPGNHALAGVKPCDLLTSDEVSRLGLRYPGEPDQVAGADTCSWSVSGNGGASAAIHPELGIADLNYEGDHSVPTEIGKYPATRIEAPLDAKYICHVVISTSESSSVQVVGAVSATSTDTAAACERATRTAELIAPKLP